MCTLIIALGMAPGPDLYVIANRDEVLDRSAEAASVHRRGAMRIFAPRDGQAGGTWIGLNEAGVFAGITNRFGLSSADHHRSRGHLVFRALEMSTARGARDAICRLSATEYNGFHLIAADETGGWVMWSDGASIRSMELTPGFYALSERSFGAAPSARLDRLAGRLQGLRTWSSRCRARFRQWMREHDENRPLEGTCVHAPMKRYGTRSSTVVELDGTWRFFHADGPPCTTEYRDHTSVVEAMKRQRSE